MERGLLIVNESMRRIMIERRWEIGSNDLILHLTSIDANDNVILTHDVGEFPDSWKDAHNNHVRVREGSDRVTHAWRGERRS